MRNYPEIRNNRENRRLCYDPEHGGDIYSLAEELKIQERKIIDFSASINPLGVPESVKLEIKKNLKYLFNYPDPDATTLRQHLSEYYDIDAESIICGNGSTELIYLIARALKPKMVFIPAPTFSEYERACRTESYRLQVTSFQLQEKNDFEINSGEFIKCMKGCNAAFLCNPNNPTGKLLRKNSVLEIANAAKKAECYLIVDEAFIDFCPEDSVINEVKNNPYLIVLRSMTKFYALSGLRIGYGVFPLHLIKALNEHKEPWTVNMLAQKAGIVALKDRTYRDKTFRLMNKEKRFLENGFKKIGIRFFRSDGNFYLLELNDADKICRGLRKKGILVRDCSNFRGLDSRYIRIAVKAHEENTMLLKELAETAQNNINCHRQHKEV